MLLMHLVLNTSQERGTMDNYRLWDKVAKRMIYSHVPEVDMSYREFFPIAFGIGYTYFKPEEFIIMRGLGLFDVTGREIYVGDKVIYGYLTDEGNAILYGTPIYMYIVTDDPFMISHVAGQLQAKGHSLLVTGNKFEGESIWLNQSMVETGS